MGRSRVVVVVQFDPDSCRTEPKVGQETTQLAEGVALGGHDVVIGVVEDARFVHVDGAVGTVGVHAPTPPPRLPIVGDDHRLRRVEGPAVVSGQPPHVGRVGGDHHLDPTLVHCRSHHCQALRVLIAAEGKVEVGHRHKVVATSAPKPIQP